MLPRPGTFVYHSSAANGLYLQARFRIFYVFTIPYNIIRELRDEGISLNDALEVANAVTKHLQEYLTGSDNAPVQEVTTYIAEDARTYFSSLFSGVVPQIQSTQTPSYNFWLGSSIDVSLPSLLRCHRIFN